jgi:hypothetical protein
MASHKDMSFISRGEWETSFDSLSLQRCLHKCNSTLENEPNVKINWSYLVLDINQIQLLTWIFLCNQASHDNNDRYNIVDAWSMRSIKESRGGKNLYMIQV